MNSSSDIAYAGETIFWLLLVSRGPARFPGLIAGFQQPVTGFGVEIEMIYLFQIHYSPASFITERVTAIKRMQDDALQQITKRQMLVLCQRFQNFNDTFL